jgi:hypothetical protein
MKKLENRVNVVKINASAPVTKYARLTNRDHLSARLTAAFNVCKSFGVSWLEITLGLLVLASLGLAILGAILCWPTYGADETSKHTDITPHTSAIETINAFIDSVTDSASASLSASFCGSAPRYGTAKDVRIVPVVVAELKFGHVERQIFRGDVVDWRPG